MAGLARPTLDWQTPQDDQVAGMGAVAPLGAGPAEGAGRRGVGQGPLAIGVGGGWDVIHDEGAALVVMATPL